MWNETGNSITKKIKFDDFKQALKFVNEVGELAETENHHPDIKLGYGFAEISLTTHSEAKVTEKDRQMSEKIDRIIDNRIE
ncbi:4a-hydroxytetrahydrobiopterin dehydratase [Candidatus Saccharibacteria bacterium]|jgi:4a-hydroxytetrahydrobiopterin dehydratase|nr:4a-hydroxytetrahydrobiopterin dehydratase [Candidatus Saccharibacteria bacterium]MBP9131705.1 4a-hydroxytetrahydrobiopterin dehydratase [Candidatus Saccharibacteria bacterium]